MKLDEAKVILEENGYILNEWLEPDEEKEFIKNANKLIKYLNNVFKHVGCNVRLDLCSNDISFSDGYYLKVEGLGDWNTKSRRVNLSLDGTTKFGVKYYDGKIYLEKGWRTTSHRGQVNVL